MKKKGWYRRLAAGIPLAAIAFLLSGCSVNMGILDPKGTIARQQLDLIIITSVLCVIILVPVLIMTYWFAWKYRHRGDGEYKPNWSHSSKIESVMWGVPIIVILIIAVLTVQYAHKLEPSKAIASEAKPITIEVTSLDWKWLFTYPEQGVASVNYVRFPANVPVEFKLTADAPMNSFWIPQLGGQIYTMSGMAMELNLMADHVGQYPGKGANFSGEHFGKMEFIAEATSQEDFDKWVADVKGSSPALTEQGYGELAEPGIVEKPTTYSSFPEGLFDRIVNKYSAGAGSGHHHGSSSSDGESADEAQAMDMGAMDMGTAGDSSTATTEHAHQHN
ncbi:ubiquinol oxidase subunit 2 [Cohnella xylanilytica]|uniref:Quinol oxidase subunit 2 n=1 Tax=Cohnella xylanilytica TaxID=557555 RepID=A0A841TTR5_9BACL|nr:ubiquinol oxidase subunit II [Cohnella xylanilytica]MBB6691565.1 ubiquinol oxidase subunit II [Cohnella xylanilytica]GIO12870.1 ubiquinol oxidase subunit 2 [Cohnella xylanilytica]